MGQVKKSEIPKRAGTTDKSISTGIKYWVCCIKEPGFDLQFVKSLNQVLYRILHKRQV
jgi:hypothetical protein